MKSKIITNYTKLSDANLITKVQSIITSLRDNEYFSNLEAKVTSLSTLKEQFVEAVDKSVSYDRVFCSQKNRIKTELNLNLSKLAQEVQLQSNYDRTVLLTTGFDLHSKKETAPLLILPKSFFVKNETTSGEIKFVLKGITNAVSYVFEITYDNPFSDNPVNWLSENASTKTYIYKHVSIKTEVFCRVIMVGTKGQTLPTSIVSVIVS